MIKPTPIGYFNGICYGTVSGVLIYISMYAIEAKGILSPIYLSMIWGTIICYTFLEASEKRQYKRLYNE